MKKSLLLIVVLLLIVSTGCGSKQISCTSDEGTIRLTYNDKKITGYSASGYNFNFDEQRKYAEKVGIEQYVDEFEQWFTSTAPNGVCERSE